VIEPAPIGPRAANETVYIIDGDIGRHRKALAATEGPD